MGFQGLTDKETKEKLYSSVGVAKPTAKDYFLDFMAVAPMAMGIPAMVAKPTAFKQLATDYKRLGGRAGQVDPGAYRKVLQGVKDIPQSVLDPIKSLGLFGPGERSMKGVYNISDRAIKYNTGRYIPAQVSAETIPHEFAHSVQHTKMGEDIRRFPTGALEAHADEFGDLYTQRVRQGLSPTSELFSSTYDDALKNVKSKYGSNPYRININEVYFNRQAKEAALPRPGMSSSSIPKYEPIGLVDKIKGWFGR